MLLTATTTITTTTSTTTATTNATTAGYHFSLILRDLGVFACYNQLMLTHRGRVNLTPGVPRVPWRPKNAMGQVWILYQQSIQVEALVKLPRTD